MLTCRCVASCTLCFSAPQTEEGSVAAPSAASWPESVAERPPYSYMAMIQFAINSTERKRMMLKDIYTWIEDHFPYFKHVAKPGWKVRRALVRTCDTAEVPACGASSPGGLSKPILAEALVGKLQWKWFHCTKLFAEIICFVMSRAIQRLNVDLQPGKGTGECSGIPFKCLAQREQVLREGFIPPSS